MSNDSAPNLSPQHSHSPLGDSQLPPPPPAQTEAATAQQTPPPPPTQAQQPAAAAHLQLQQDGKPYAIQVSNLVRSYPGNIAVRGISFKIPHGSITGFVGSNGAGKTTTMRILATLDNPTRGNVWINGAHSVHQAEKVRRSIGWVPDHYEPYAHTSVYEIIDFFARAYGFKGAEREQRIEEILDFTDLQSLRGRMANKLSKGQTQRLCLARALINDPQILILDEPAAGLDPKARVELKNLLRILAEDGKTIFISSHILSELAEICDSLLFINRGQLLHHGDAESMLDSSNEDRVYDYIIEFAPDARRDWQQFGAWCLLQPNIKVVDQIKNGYRVHIHSSDAGQIAALLGRIIKEGFAVSNFSRQKRALEEAFIEIVSKSEQGLKINSMPPKPEPLATKS